MFYSKFSFLGLTAFSYKHIKQVSMFIYQNGRLKTYVLYKRTQSPDKWSSSGSNPFIAIKSLFIFCETMSQVLLS